MHILLHTYIHVYMYLFIGVCVWVHVCTWIPVTLWVLPLCLCIYMHICICMFVYMCVCGCIHVCGWVYTYVCVGLSDAASLLSICIHTCIYICNTTNTMCFRYPVGRLALVVMPWISATLYTWLYRESVMSNNTVYTLGEHVVVNRCTGRF